MKREKKILISHSIRNCYTRTPHVHQKQKQRTNLNARHFFYIAVMGRVAFYWVHLNLFILKSKNLHFMTGN